MLVFWGPAFLIPTEVESKGDIFVLVVFVPIVVQSKGGQLIETFFALKLLVLFLNLKIIFIVKVMV